MHEVNNQKKKQLVIIKYASLMLFVSLIFFVFSLMDQSNVKLKNSVQEDKSTTPTPSAQNDPTDQWEKYTNEKYGYEVLVPRLLLPKTYENNQGYLEFVIFYENQYSQGKGVAIGVSENSLQDEVKKIQDKLNDEGTAQLTRQSVLTFKGEKGVRLDYDPKDITLGYVKRSIMIVHHGKYSYSFSTTPDQIESVVSTLEFTR